MQAISGLSNLENIFPLKSFANKGVHIYTTKLCPGAWDGLSNTQMKV